MFLFKWPLLYMYINIECQFHRLINKYFRYQASNENMANQFSCWLNGRNGCFTLCACNVFKIRNDKPLLFLIPFTPIYPFEFTWALYNIQLVVMRLNDKSTF